MQYIQLSRQDTGHAKTPALGDIEQIWLWVITINQPMGRQPGRLLQLTSVTTIDGAVVL